MNLDEELNLDVTDLYVRPKLKMLISDEESLFCRWWTSLAASPPSTPWLSATSTLLRSLFIPIVDNIPWSILFFGPKIYVHLYYLVPWLCLNHKVFPTVVRNIGLGSSSFWARVRFLLITFSSVRWRPSSLLHWLWWRLSPCFMLGTIIPLHDIYTVQHSLIFKSEINILSRLVRWLPLS